VSVVLSIAVKNESKKWKKTETCKFQLDNYKSKLTLFFILAILQSYCIGNRTVPSIVAVPLAAQQFPQQKIHARDEWGPIVSTLLRASSTGQLLIPSTQTSLSARDDDDDDDDDDSEQLHSRKQTSFGRMAASSDDDDR